VISDLGQTSNNAFSGAVWSAVFSKGMFTLLVTIALLAGWRQRNEYNISAEYGLGYALGIIGGVLMLLLLIYPLRKRLKHRSKPLISIKAWFKLHMVFGILGPLCILYHCNFSFGSVNSNVALLSMGLMVSSGLIGRFIYTKIHHGLYGQRIKLQELQTKRGLSEQRLIKQYQGGEQLAMAVESGLHVFEEKVSTRKGMAVNLMNVLSLGFNTRRCQRKLNRLLAKHAKLNSINLSKRHVLQTNTPEHQVFAIRSQIKTHLKTVRKIAEFGFYERLFSLWHLLHLPIFFMLIATGLVHVYAVHVY